MVKSGKRETAEDREACLQRETDTHLSTRSEHSQSGAQRTIPLRSRLKVRGFRFIIPSQEALQNEGHICEQRSRNFLTFGSLRSRQGPFLGMGAVPVRLTCLPLPPFSRLGVTAGLASKKVVKIELASRVPVPRSVLLAVPLFSPSPPPTPFSTIRPSARPLLQRADRPRAAACPPFLSGGPLFGERPEKQLPN